MAGIPMLQKHGCRGEGECRKNDKTGKEAARVSERQRIKELISGRGKKEREQLE